MEKVRSPCQKGEDKRWKKSEMQQIRKEKMQVRQKVGKSRNTMFPMFCGASGSKTRFPKAAGAEPAGQMKNQNLHAIVAQNTFVNEYVQKNLSFGSLLKLEMSEKCTPLWREASWQVKV